VKLNRVLIKVNRISAWILLIFMATYIITGYAWTKHIFMPTSLARLLHTDLDLYMMPVFLVHILLGTKFALKRWGFHNDHLVNLTLLVIGFASYIAVLMVR